MPYAPRVGDIILQFLASAAGITLLVAITRGLHNAFTERGARRSVDAAKAAQDLLLLLPYGEASAVITARHRDRELANLGRAIERVERRKRTRSRFAQWIDRASALLLSGSIGGAVFFCWVNGRIPRRLGQLPTGTRGEPC